MTRGKIFLFLIFVLSCCVSCNGQSSGGNSSGPTIFGRFRFNFLLPPLPTPDTETEPAAGTSEERLFPFPFPQPQPRPRPIPVDPFAPCPPRPFCPFPPRKFYSTDGSCNNLGDPGRGQAHRPHKRLVPSNYADGRGSPRTGSGRHPLPSARLVSTSIQETGTRKSIKNTHILPIWFQYLAHDITNTPTINRAEGVDCRCGSRDSACFNVRVARNDRQFIEERKTCLPVVRSQPFSDAKCNTRIRQQGNTITPYLDAGTVYGNSPFQLNELLDPTSRIGRLKTGALFPHGFSPPNAQSLPLVTQVHTSLRGVACPFDVHKPAGVPCFFAGDDRANENPALSSFHTLFVRMHNELVAGLNRVNPHWNKDQLVNNARLIVAAVTQRITYKEFLPELLGEEYMKRFGLSVLDQGFWEGYDATYDATASNGFISAAFRFGHTLVTSPLSRENPFWNPHGRSLILKDNFFNSGPLLTTAQGGANSILRGLCDDPIETADTTFVDDLRNFLFAPEGRLGHDLLSINIQRGRDHGIPGYNLYREFCGLKRAKHFNEFVEIPRRQRENLRTVYTGRVDDVDLYVGGLAENAIRGGIFGPTFSCLLAYQFRDFKRGDRLWHENGGVNAVFTPAQLQAIRDYKLSKLLCDQLKDTKTIQSNPFQQITRSGNFRKSCRQFARLNINAWRDGGFNPLGGTAGTEFTEWFPANLPGFDSTSSRLHSHLLRSRPDDVCRNILNSEERRINGNRQYRYSCAAGSIKGTDYPNVDASKGVWGPWEDASTLGRYNDKIRRGSNNCINPIAIQVFTKSGSPARATGQVFRTFNPTNGFLCRGSDQSGGRCHDYKVRYFCQRLRPTPPPTTPPTQPPTTPPTQPPFTRPSRLIWTRWISTDSAFGGLPGGDLEYLANVANRIGFCRNPIQIQGRTVFGKIPSFFAGNVLQVSARIGHLCFNFQQNRRRFCQDYEVRYQCKQSDIN